MSNSQWHDDQATGERALREHKRRADLDSLVVADTALLGGGM